MSDVKLPPVCMACRCCRSWAAHVAELEADREVLQFSLDTAAKERDQLRAQLAEARAEAGEWAERAAMARARGWREGRDAAVAAIRGERLHDNTETESDLGYQSAIEDCELAIRALAAPLPESGGVPPTSPYTARSQTGEAAEATHVDASAVVRSASAEPPPRGEVAGQPTGEAERWRRFNDTTGALTWNRRSAAEHPDRCRCQGEHCTPHKHYSEPPHACARCSPCMAYEPAVPAPASPPPVVGTPYATGAEFVAAAQQAITPRTDEEIREMTGMEPATQPREGVCGQCGGAKEVPAGGFYGHEEGRCGDTKPCPDCRGGTGRTGGAG